MKKLLTLHLLPHRYKSRFYNQENDWPEHMLFQTLPSFIGSLRNRAQRLPQEPEKWCAIPTFPQRSHVPLVTWLGHASFLIQVNGINMLVDPVFDTISRFFPRMIHPITTAAQLPPIDIVLLSHNHPDHTDMKSLQALPVNKDRFFGVAQGDKQWMDEYALGRVEEFGWWEQMDVATDQGMVTVTFLPARHWSARGLFDRNRSLWGSWMIQAGGHTLYFGGDSAYWEHFTAIAKEFPFIALALLPIAPCEPAAWMQRTHLSPEQAVQAGMELKAKTIIPMHWGTFPFGVDLFDVPLQRLQAAWKQQLPPSNQSLVLLKIGQSITI